MIGMGSLLTVPAVKADNIDTQRSQIQQSIEAAQSQLSDLQAERAKIEAQINNIENAIGENTGKINETNEQMKAAQAEVDALNEEIDAIQKRIDIRNDILKERAVSFQENGGKIAYIDVLLGSSSFKEFIERVEAVATIMEADTSMIKEHEADQESIEEKKQSVTSKLSDLNDLKVELEGMSMHIHEQKAQAEGLKQELVQRANASEEEIANLRNKDEELAAEARAALEAAASSTESTTAATKEETSNNNTVTSKSDNESKTIVQTSNSVAPTSGGLATVIKAGYKYIGNSTYKFGAGRTASDIANGYFDCSGFVSWAFRQGGYSIGASTSVLRNTGTKISINEARPGDLVFFDTYKKDGHVGIYLGGGKFIGSQSSTGVAIANMNSGYYKDTFNGHVRRVVN